MIGYCESTYVLLYNILKHHILKMKKKSVNKWKKPIIKHGKMTKYNYIVQYPENLTLGRFFDIGEFTYINAQYGITNENNVQIGSHCSIYSNYH